MARDNQAGSASTQIADGKQPTNVALRYPINVDRMRKLRIAAYEFNAEDRNNIQNAKQRGSVYLPLPIEIQTTHSAQWNPETMHLPTAQQSSGDSSVWSSFWSYAQDVGSRAVGRGLQGANPLSQSTDVQSGSTINPALELSYSQHGLRQFQYTYQFVPKNLQEAQQVQKIKKFLQRYSHAEAGSTVPQRQADRIRYPSMFNVSFLETDNSLMTSLTQSLPCQLVDLTIIDNSMGFSSFITGQDGVSYPHSTSINMTFQEYRMRMQEDFD